MLNIKKNFSYIVVAALVLVLFVSCKSKVAPEDPESQDFSVPTATGDNATDLTDGIYEGSLNRESYVVKGISDADAQKEIPATEKLTLEIRGNKIINGILFGEITEAQIKKSGSEYSASGETSNAFGANMKEYIKFTVSEDKQTITVIEYIVVGTQDEKSFKGTYAGTLTNQTTVY